MRHDEAAGGQTSTLPAGNTSEAGLTVLYVEDDFANIRLMERILKRRPKLRLVSAVRGGLAVDLAIEHEPRLIILDLHLPDIGGEEVLQRLQANPVTSGIPVIFLSGDVGEINSGRLVDRGIIAHFSKPFDVNKLLTFMDTILKPNEASTSEDALEGPDGDGGSRHTRRRPSWDWPDTRE